MQLCMTYENERTKCAFGSKLKSQLILLFSLFLLLFMGSTILFQLTFTFIYNTFSKKNNNNNFSKISGFQIDPK